MGIKFAGIDLAKRVDSSAFISLELEDGILWQHAEKIWNGVDYHIVAEKLAEYHRLHKFNRIGFDETGVGIAVAELFKNRTLYQPIVMSNTRKIEIINLVQSLLQQNRLKIIKGGELHKEVEEQQWDFTDAGNIQYRHPQGRHDDLFWALGYACYVAGVYLMGHIKPTMAIAKEDFRDLDDKIDDEMERMLETV